MRTGDKADFEVFRRVLERVRFDLAARQNLRFIIRVNLGDVKGFVDKIVVRAKNCVAINRRRRVERRLRRRRDLGELRVERGRFGERFEERVVPSGAPSVRVSRRRGGGCVGVSGGVARLFGSERGGEFPFRSLCLCPSA